jgi:hypothetical protein
MPRIKKQSAASKTTSKTIKKTSKTPQLPVERSTTGRRAGAPLAGAPLAAAQSPKSGIKKYVVQCKYHTIASLSYRIYAPTKRDAEGIARIKFNEDLSHDRILDAVTAVEVVKK